MKPWLLPALVASAWASSADSQLAEDVLHDKNVDAWTTSSQFKIDLVSLFNSSRNETVLEVGAHLGHCTRVLSRLFGTVLALENSAQVLKSNAARNEDLRNVVYLKFHSVMDDWGLFSNTPIHAVFIDAAHDYGSVRSDLQRTLALPHVRTIVLDDYGTTAGVHRAVDEAVAAGLVKVRSFIGRAPPWSYDGSRISDWEGIVLEPLPQAPAEQPSLESSMLGSSWVVYPAGVFTTGYFTPHGLISLDKPHEASSSYGPMEWRQLTAQEAEGQEVLVLQLTEAPHWRFQATVTEARTGMALFRDDGVVLVAVPQTMMRVIGDKLLSFLH
ncbi:unnamed protein product [Symbiodinium natans]|uniref:Methyltransferase domain-containing protein n=1 Tax=Symbiodinium natans TaxID=878477 RepID=A0A812P8T5_9DINO|nr:unnamed protein product [Symbiodinium natans]